MEWERKAAQAVKVSETIGNMSGEEIQNVEHTADWSIRVTGSDLGGLFSNAAQGMAMLLVEDRQGIACDIERDVVLDAYDAESLLVEFLGELAYWAESEQLVMCSVVIDGISDTHLAARVQCGEAPLLDKHIKAVTYHDLAIKKADSGLVVTLVFDV